MKINFINYFPNWFFSYETNLKHWVQKVDIIYKHTAAKGSSLDSSLWKSLFEMPRKVFRKTICFFDVMPWKYSNETRRMISNWNQVLTAFRDDFYAFVFVEANFTSLRFNKVINQARLS